MPGKGRYQVAVETKVTEKEARAVAEAARDTAWTRPSFAKELFLGRFQLDLVHPHPRPNALVQALLSCIK